MIISKAILPDFPGIINLSGQKYLIINGSADTPSNYQENDKFYAKYEIYEEHSVFKLENKGHVCENPVHCTQV